jgi:hypothetical protein
VAKKEPEFSDILCTGIRPEMRDRLNRLNRDKCAGFAPTSELVRHLLDAALTWYGYPSPQAQAQGQFAPPLPPTQPQPAPSPFAQAPDRVAANGR